MPVFFAQWAQIPLGRTGRPLYIPGMLHRLLLVIFAVLSVAHIGCDKNAKEKAEIRAAFNQVRDGNHSSDGQGMTAVLTQRTFDHYAKIVKMGMDSKAQDVWNLQPCDMYEVLRMRNRAKRAQLKSLDGKSYLIFACKEGWFSHDAEGWELGKINVAGDTALGTVHHPEWEAAYAKQQVASVLSRRSMRYGDKLDKPFTYTCQFIKEGGVWKLDEPSMHNEYNRRINDAAKEARMSVRDFLMAFEEEESGNDIKMNIWDPMKK